MLKSSVLTDVVLFTTHVSTNLNSNSQTIQITIYLLIQSYIILGFTSTALGYLDDSMFNIRIADRVLRLVFTKAVT